MVSTLNSSAHCTGWLGGGLCSKLSLRFSRAPLPSGSTLLHPDWNSGLWWGNCPRQHLIFISPPEYHPFNLFPYFFIIVNALHHLGCCWIRMCGLCDSAWTSVLPRVKSRGDGSRAVWAVLTSQKPVTGAHRGQSECSSPTHTHTHIHCN